MTGQLHVFVERVENLEAEIAALNGDKREVYAEAKATGFNVKILKRVIAHRRREATERDAEDATFELYLSALDGAPRVRAHNACTREALPPHDPATGEVIEPLPAQPTAGDPSGRRSVQSPSAVPERAGVQAPTLVGEEGQAAGNVAGSAAHVTEPAIPGPAAGAIMAAPDTEIEELRVGQDPPVVEGAPGIVPPCTGPPPQTGRVLSEEPYPELPACIDRGDGARVRQLLAMPSTAPEPVQ